MEKDSNNVEQQQPSVKTEAEEDQDQAEVKEEVAQAYQNGTEEKQEEDDEDEIEEGSLIKAGSNDVGKIFVGGLSWDTTTAELKKYFSSFGTVKDCTIKIDTTTGRSRGFGFVLFEDPESVIEVIETRPHTLGGRTIDPKKAMALKKETKLFAGGFPAETSTEKLNEYFGTFGEIELLERPLDKQTQKPRGFCFVTYKTEDEAKAACATRYQEIDGNRCEVKNAEPQKNKKLMGPYGFHSNPYAPYHPGSGNYGGYGDYGYGPGHGGYHGYGGYNGGGYGHGPHSGYGGYGSGGYGGYGGQHNYSGYGGSHSHFGNYQSGGYGGGTGQHQQVSTGMGKGNRRGQSSFKQY